MKIIQQIDTRFWERVREMDSKPTPGPNRHLWMACIALACVTCALSWVHLRQQATPSTKDRSGPGFHGQRSLHLAYELMDR